MKVILLTDVKRLGKRHDIVDVKAGYAQAFLIPQKKAVQATADATAQIEALKASQAEVIAAEKDAAAKVIQALDGKTITLTLSANEQGGLYESVTDAQVVAAAKKQLEVVLAPEYFELPSIKETGDHDIALAYEDLAGTLKLTIEAEAST